MLVAARRVGGGGDLKPRGPLKITSSDEDELSRARADGNRRPQMRVSCSGGEQCPEGKEARRAEMGFFSKRPLARKQLRRANGDWSQRPISSLRCSTNKYKRP